MQNNLMLLCLCFTLLVACTSEEQASANLPYYADASFTPYWLETGDESLDTFHTIRPFQLINQLGDSVTEKSLAGKIYVADFFFTACPGICPKMTTNMAILQDSFRLERNVMLLSHSVTPKYDSVSVLQEYAEAKGVEADKWWLLTGEREQIYRLGRKDYFVEEDLGQKKEEDDFLHTENFVLIDENRHIRGIYNGLNKASLQQLIKDVKTLLPAK